MTDLMFNPNTATFDEFDAPTRRILRATVDYFENLGKQRLLADNRDRVWYSDYLDFVKRESVFATFLTPKAQAAGDPDKRWDTARIAMMSRILGFYGMQYWYVWQVTILGLGPIWQSANEAAKARAAAALDSGEIFAFGLSEQAHGADVYSTDMILRPDGDGFRATGEKYYIGNGNKAAMVSVFGRRSDRAVIDSTNLSRKVDGDEYGGYLFFVADSGHDRYRLHKNVVDSQMYVASFGLDDYPVTSDDVLHRGRAAFDAAMNTVNVGKFNLGFGAIGACEHAIYEAVTHAENRELFGHRVTEFPQVAALLADSYARLTGMQLYSERAIDYMRCADSGDRRYLLFSAIEKMSVTRTGQQVYQDLADVIAARGFENDTYFAMALPAMFGLPRLEGTVHVNMALALKFLPNFLFHPSDAAIAGLKFVPVSLVRAASPILDRAGRVVVGSVGAAIPALRRELDDARVPEVGRRRDAADDEFLFRQGPSSGLGRIRFGDWRAIFAKFSHIPNVALFTEQALGLQALIAAAPPSAEQAADVDFLFAVGEMFTLLPYAQLILEQAAQDGTPEFLLDHLFDVLVRDFSRHAVTLYGKPTARRAQQTLALRLVRRPGADAERARKVVDVARSLAGRYEMAQ